MDFALPVRNIRDYKKSAYENYMPEIIKSNGDARIINCMLVDVKALNYVENNK